MSTDHFDHTVDRKVHSKPVRRIELITGVECIRDWTPEQKRILAESFEDGVVISEVARRHGLLPQQLFAWRSEFRKRQQLLLQNTCAVEPPAFAPVMIAQSYQEEAVADAPLTTTAPEQTAACLVRSDGAPASIEIVLGGVSIHLQGAVDGKTLTTVLKAVRSTL